MHPRLLSTLLCIIVISVCQAQNMPDQTSGPQISKPQGSTWDTLLSSLPPSLNLSDWGVNDPTTQQTVNSFYGSAMGRPQCMKRSACIAGNFVQNVPGKDIFFIFANSYIPQEWNLYYNIFRISAMYGQNCLAYPCDDTSVNSETQPLSNSAPPTPIPAMTPQTIAQPVSQNKQSDTQDNELHKINKPPGF